MTPATLLRQLCAALEAQQGKPHEDGRRHTAHCPHSKGTTVKWQDGAGFVPMPCPPRCQAVRDALAAAEGV